MKLSSVLVLAVVAVATTSSVYAQTDAAAGSKASDFVSGVGAPMLDGSDDDGSDSLDATVAPARTTTTTTMGSSSDSMDSMDHSSSSKTSGTVRKSNSTSTTPAPTSAAGTAHQTILASVVTLAVTAAAALAC